MSTRRDVYWAAQAALLTFFVLQLMLPAIPWQLTATTVLIAQLYLIPSRLKDAGRKPWLPLVVVGGVVGALWLLGQLVAALDDGTGDGLGLLWVMLGVVVSCLTAAALIIWPGLLPSQPRVDR